MPWRGRLRYWFDDYMSRGALSIFVALTVVFLSLLAILGTARALLLVLIDVEVERGDGLIMQVFLTFLELTDPGSMTQDVDSSWAVKVFTVISGITGVVLFSSLIAFITTAVDSRLAQLRKGHSVVMENDHTLILGWNERVVEIVSELIIANESEDKPVVVILADREKEFMDDYLSVNLPRTCNTKVVTRAGKPSSLINLKTVAFRYARSVIILASCNSGSTQHHKDESDMKVVKTVLAVTSTLDADSEVPVVAELFSEQRRSLAQSIAPDRVVCLDVDDILAKIIVQTSRNSGLSLVYEEMLSFEGAELYLFEDSWADGETFGDVAFQFVDGVPIGTLRGEVVEINPPIGTPLHADTRLIVLASDDSALRLDDSRRPIPTRPDPLGSSAAQRTERQLIIGWNPKLGTIMEEYDSYVLPGSQIDLAPRWRTAAIMADLASIASQSDESMVVVLGEDPHSHEGLLAMDPASYDNVILLSEEHQGNTEEWIDSETLLILLQLQRILASVPEGDRPKLIAEILGADSRHLVASSGVKEFVISNKFISMLVAQISENRELEAVYDNLFAEEGSEVYLKTADLYLGDLPREYSFAELMAAAQSRGEIAIGVKVSHLESSADANYGVVLVPDKASRFTLTRNDSLIVVAENEL